VELPAEVRIRGVGPRDGSQNEPEVIATQDLVSMLHEMGIATGVDLRRLLAASADVQEVLGRPLPAHTLTAGPVDWHRG
jgi:isopropylmalate/homocitrate/citramalate synthase